MFELGKKDALIIVDAQNDFVEGGALAVEGGNAIMNGINELSKLFFEAGATIVMTQDFHPVDHKSFASNHDGKAAFEEADMPYGKQTLWPNHCVQGTPGAAFHSKVLGAAGRAAAIIRKGMNPDVDSYSAFLENDKETSTGLAGFLHHRDIERCFFVGIAYDFCVGYSAVDAVKLGFESWVVKDLTAAIGMPLPLGYTDGQALTTIDVIEDDFERNGVELMPADEFYATIEA